MTLKQGIIMTVFDVVGYILISNRLLMRKEINRVYMILYILVTSIAIALSGEYIPREYNIFIAGLILIIITKLIYKLSNIETICVYIISAVFVLCIQFFVLTILGSIVKNLEYNFYYGLICQTIGLGIILLICKRISISPIFQYVIDNNKIFIFLILNSFIVLGTLLFYWHVDIDGVIENMISVGFLSIGVIYINFVLLKNGLKNEYESRQLQIYEKYLPVIDELINELRVRQHEFDNHVQALKMISITGRNHEDIAESVKEYTKELDIKNDLGDLIKLDNKILAGFLYSKKKLAQQLGIDFKIIIENYVFETKLKNFELIEIVGNLIDNAFEARKENNVVRLVLSKEKDMNVIEVSNKHPYLKKDTLSTLFKKGFSTKMCVDNIKRGYGLHTVKELTRKYNGTIEVQNDIHEHDNYVVFRVLVG